ncbi:MAG: 50S ribosomal protein L6 [Candidatus Aenigmarchaeota archaeon]|nr:50S ribosomal protein L6 [Candidatus Aenigmarchaeota archaeon]
MEAEISVPDGIQASLERGVLKIKGPRGEQARHFANPTIGIRLEDGLIRLVYESKKEKKGTKAVVGTWEMHIRNMISGAQKGWEARLKIVYSHFPVRFSVEGKEVLIQNFLGEKKARKARINGNAKVDVVKDEVIVTGVAKEEVGQTAANIELATRVTGRDRRVFQDGCYIVEKPRPQIRLL